MNKPKMTIVSDGCSTQMVLDGVLIAKGICGAMPAGQ